jgi:hypothetical protein
MSDWLTIHNAQELGKERTREFRRMKKKKRQAGKSGKTGRSIKHHWPTDDA